MTGFSVRTTHQTPAPPLEPPPITPTVTVTTMSLPAGTVGVAYNAQFAATGGTAPYTWTVTGLPAGLSASAAGAITGTPSAAATTTVNVTARDTNNVASNPVNFSLTVNAAGAVMVTTASLPPGMDGVAYPNTQLTASGGTGSYTWTVTGLPAGLSATTGGLITGTPNATATATVTVAATDTASIASSPVDLSLTVNAAAAPGAPQRIFPGQSLTNMLYMLWWPPVSGTPDYYSVYDGETQIATDIVPTALMSPWNNAAPQLFYVHQNLAPSTTHTYTVTATTAGLEGPHSTPLVMTTLAGQVSRANPPTLPQPASPPATWLLHGGAPYFPVGGTRWNATNTSDNWNNAVGIPGTTGSTGVLSEGCSLLYAVRNCVPGDIIVVTAGATYGPNPAQSYAYPTVPGGFMGSTDPNLPLVITTDQCPEYRTFAGLGGGTLIPYAYTQQNQTLQPFTLTAPLAAGATSATLTAPWAGRTGTYPTMFLGTDAHQTCTNITVLFTNGSTAISWYWALPNAALARIGVGICTGVTRYDIPTMTTIKWKYYGFRFNAGTSNVRFIGIHLESNDQDIFNYYAVQGYPVSVWQAEQPSLQHFYFDRCIIGSNTEGPWTSLAFQNQGMVLQCTGLLVHQCWIGGLFMPPSGVDNYCLGIYGGPSCIRNSYLEAGSEGLITGGGWSSEEGLTCDMTYEYNINNKPASWQWQVNPTPNVPDGANNYPGEKIKNHFEYKLGVRLNCHGNLHMNCWHSYAGTGSQRGRSLVFGPRDSSGAVLATSPITRTCPWVVCTDLDMYDNEIWNVGQALYLFNTDDAGTLATHIARVHFHNNTVLINPGQSAVGLDPAVQAVFPGGASWPQGSQPHALPIAGPCADLTFNKNTIIFNPNSPHYAPGYAFAGSITISPYGPAAVPQPTTPFPYAERILAIDNVLSGNQTFQGTQGPGNALTGAAAMALFNYSLFDNNLTVQDALASVTSGTWYKAIPYANLGMTNFNTASYPPVPVTDWNITTGPYTTAATDGGPLGATH